ncbi:MAG: hypothetical protein ACT4PZ_09405 [Panacagrimonas sp.]
MNARSQILCAWCGILCPLVMFIGLWPAAGFFPPHLPSASAEEIAAIYQRDAIGIRFGTILLLVAGGLVVPFVAAISAQMRRIEHPASPVLTYTQLVAGAAGVLFFIIPAMIWTVAAYRPERSPEITQTLNDIGWLFFVMPFVLAFVQNFALGFAVISDRRQRPVFPRWLGYFNFWIALLFVPGCLITFFKSGPFAWNGIIAFWIPAAIFGPWFFVVATYVIKAAKQQAADGE